MHAKGVDMIPISTMRHAEPAQDSAARQAAIADEARKLTAMTKFHNMTMPVGWAPPGSAFRKDYDVMNASLLVIDSQGKVAKQFSINLDRLRAELEKITAKRVAAGH